MLSSISWGEYVSTILVFLACYYAYVGYKYFRWEMLAAIGIKKVETSTAPIAVDDFKKQFISESHADYLPKEVADVDITPVVNAFEDEVRAFLQETGSDTDRASLLTTLKQICMKYSVLRSSDNLNELNLFILTEVDKYKPEIVSMQDIQHLWR